MHSQRAARHIEALIGEYQRGFTAGSSNAVLLPTGIALVGVMLAWITFRKPAGDRA
ncbi:MAG: hypothetical protein NZ528_09060 [Caldilineales bacterium]|nr:hypothetical protein [Caldilineales bacterium]MDW8319431.1 hypothetical protein [Anaerolineae bacterium]